MNGALLVAGTTSDAGKSAVTTGICRWLARQGVRVAPFKAQNMSNNSAVTRDGAEIARPQAAQAAAACIEPEAAMNPVLLKPDGERSSQVVVDGRPMGDVSATSYRDLKPRLHAAVREAYARLRGRYDVVICEGAGSPAEINLRSTDIANMGLAQAAGMPVVVVGDVDRGGMFAALHGTLALLSAEDQSLVAGFVGNKFRGDPDLLAPGLDQLRALTGRAVLGVLPWADGLWIDGEDSLALDGDRAFGGDRGLSGPPRGRDVLRVAAVRLPRLSQFTDLDALACEPGVALRYVTTPAEVADADLVVLPGTRAAVADLEWLRSRGLDAALATRVARGGPVLGVCGGYRMLCESLDDTESGAGHARGLGLLPARARFASDSTVARTSGEWRGLPVAAYEIHRAAVRVPGDAEAFLDGCRAGSVFGTAWHGAFENDGFRREFLAEVAGLAGRDFAVAPDVDFAGLREARLDALGDLVAGHLDTAALWRLIDRGPPTDLPFVPPGLGAYAGE